MKAQTRIELIDNTIEVEESYEQVKDLISEETAYIQLTRVTFNDAELNYLQKQIKELENV